MDTHDSQHTTCHHDTRDAEEGQRSQLARRLRLVSRLMRAEMQRTIHAEPAPTRGEVKAAARALEDRATAALSQEELATTLAALDKIAEALGGRDALPYRERRGFRPRGRGRGGFGPHGSERRGFRRGGFGSGDFDPRNFDPRGFENGTEHDFGPHAPDQGHCRH